MFRKLLSIVLLLFVSVALQAQQANTAILVGVISDSTGAFLPGATVTATHVATNTSVDILTDGRGQYRTPPLRIGDYELTVRLDGFRTRDGFRKRTVRIDGRTIACQTGEPIECWQGLHAGEQWAWRGFPLLRALGRGVFARAAKVPACGTGDVRRYRGIDIPAVQEHGGCSRYVGESLDSLDQR